jgi:hypothetical protein
VPVLVGEGAELAIQDAAHARLNAQLAAQARSNADDAMDVDESSSTEEVCPVKMVVIDGVVMGPTHCAFDDCIEEVKNSREGVFCAQHEITHGNLCRMYDCDKPKVPPGRTCAINQNCWYQHAIRYGQQSMLGIRQLIRRSDEERLDWLPQRNQQVQPYDDDAHSQIEKITILFLLVFIVWKPSVLHVVQCMLGHCLTKLNLQQIF